MLINLNQQRWANAHGTFDAPVDAIYRVTNARDGDRPSWREGARALGELVQLAEAAGKTLCPIGSAWSLSTAVDPDSGWLVDTRHLNVIPKVGLRKQWTTHPDVPSLVFTQAGVEIAELHRTLAMNDLSLSTSGASCGQTIAGALSTGTHGSAFKVGSIQEMVLGLHIIRDGGESVWVEPDAGVGMTDEWVDWLGATLVRDTDQFESALVSFGTFGLIHAVLLRAEPLFLLKRHRYRLALDAALADVGRSGDKLAYPTAQLPAPDKGLYHFEYLINPNDVASKGVIVNTLFRSGLVTDYEYDDRAPRYLERGDDVLRFIARVLAKLQQIGVDGLGNQRIRKEVRTLESSRYKETGDDPEVGVLGELFPRTDFPPGGNSMEIGVDANDAEAAVRAVLGVISSKATAFPGLIGVRFVRQSRAALAFTRFPVTCTIELPMIEVKGWTRVLFDEICEHLQHEEIEYTLHWGQALDFGRTSAAKMYGAAAVKRWTDARNAFLGTAGRATFRNRLLNDSGVG